VVGVVRKYSHASSRNGRSAWTKPDKPINSSRS
jgi:hypothetical protein